MSIVLILYLGLIILCAIIFAYANYDYHRFIRKMSNKHSIEHINEIISNDETFINSKSFGGHMLEMILDHKELWERIKNHKLKNEQHEDTLS